MQEISYEEAEAQGIDTSMIVVCRKLRKLAKLDRVVLDESEHRSGLNKHLFDYIEYCGMDVLMFVKNYLSNLQPYMIERRLLSASLSLLSGNKMIFIPVF